MDFKDRLESLRRERGLNQEVLATACGVSLTTYRRWEWGTTEPHYSELVTLAKTLGVPVSELMGEDSMSPPDKIVLRHGPLSLEIPVTPEGLAFLEKKLSEFTASEKSPKQSLRAG